MLFGDFQAELGVRLKLTADERKTDEQKAILSRKLNDAYKEVARAYDWEHLKRTGELLTVPNYTDGSVAITINSNIVTGTSTVWTSSMEGRYFQPQGSGNWYRISKVNSATELVLLTPIIEASAGGQTYKIWKRFYYLYSEVRRIMDFGSWIVDGQLINKPAQYFQDNVIDISVTGEPSSFSLYGADPFERSYSDGTISLVKDSNLLSGVGTLWLANVDAGDIVKVGTLIFRVKRVESDTAIRLTTRAASDISGSPYSTEKDLPVGIQLYFSANKAYLFPYTYSKRVYDMQNDLDRPELPEEFDLAILDGAEANRLRDLNDSRWVKKLGEYSARIKDLMGQRFISNPRSRVMAPKISTRGGYING